MGICIQKNNRGWDQKKPKSFQHYGSFKFISTLQHFNQSFGSGKKGFQLPLLSPKISPWNLPILSFCWASSRAIKIHNCIGNFFLLYFLLNLYHVFHWYPHVFLVKWSIHPSILICDNFRKSLSHASLKSMPLSFPGTSRFPGTRSPSQLRSSARSPRSAVPEPRGTTARDSQGVPAKMPKWSKMSFKDGKKGVMSSPYSQIFNCSASFLGGCYHLVISNLPLFINFRGLRNRALGPRNPVKFKG